MDKLLDKYEAEARKRQLATPKQGDRIPDRQKIAQREFGKAAKHAATVTNTNRKYIYDFKRINEEAPELADKIRSGETTIQEAGERQATSTGGSEPQLRQKIAQGEATSKSVNHTIFLFRRDYFHYRVCLADSSLVTTCNDTVEGSDSRLVTLCDAM